MFSTCFLIDPTTYCEEISISNYILILFERTAELFYFWGNGVVSFFKEAGQILLDLWLGKVFLDLTSEA